MSELQGPLRHFSVRITAHTPLALGDESKLGNFEQTIDFIPGSVLRGAVAGRALDVCSQPAYKDNHAACSDREQCDFWKLFSQDQAIFGNAYPGLSGPVYPFPLTARTCKYYPGLPREDRILEEAHGVFDILIPRFIYELASDPEFTLRSELLDGWERQHPNLPEIYSEKCPRCGEPSEPIPGYYTQAEVLLPGGQTFVRRSAHVGINRARFVAEDSLLFTQEALDTRGTRTQFFGQATAPAELAGLLEKYLEGEHFLGRGRSRGYGHVTVGVNPPNPQDGLDERRRAFQARLQAAWGRLRTDDPRLPERLPGEFISLTLRSPAILEDLGRPHLIPTPEEIGLPQARLVRAWTRPSVISGWDVAAGLPRRTSLAACAGSVYLYHLPSGALPRQALEDLEGEGIGTERGRGMGQVTLCAPFHWMSDLSSGGNHG
jgi:CRISPR-associated protein Csx10